MTHSAAPEPTAEDEQPPALPSFSEQVSDQLGGVRGMVESSVPVLAFVIVNIIWSLKPALVISVAVGLAIAGYRLRRREPIRHAVNGLFGTGIGAVIAWRTGEPQLYYVPGILLGIGYGVAMIISIIARRPLVGWIWSLVADKGAKRWYEDAGLRRTFNWLTVLWAATYLAKSVLNVVIFYADSLTDDQKATILGAIRIGLGFPPYALLAALTVWAVRRYLRTHPDTEERGEPLDAESMDQGLVDVGVPDAETPGRPQGEFKIVINRRDGELSPPGRD